MKPEPPRPILEQLRRATPWCWVVCEHSMHRRPLAFLPFIIRWGPDASSDMLRRSVHQVRPQGRCFAAPELGRQSCWVRAVPDALRASPHVAVRCRKRLLQPRVSADGQRLSIEEQAPQGVLLNRVGGGRAAARHAVDATPR
jgi:hypothetical protein